MFRAAFDAVGRDDVYGLFPVAPGALGWAVAGLRALGVAGVNVTLPHKTTIGAHLDGITGDAAILGAVNVVTRASGTGWPAPRLVGHNTDAEGLRRALGEAGLADLDGGEGVVLGAGGAARAAVLALARMGAGRVVVAARRERAARTVVADLRGAVSAELAPADLNDASWTRTDGVRVVVQATSATLGTGEEPRRFADGLPLSALSPSRPAIVDLVYAPEDTEVLRRARALGLPTVGGLGMLVHQAALAFEAWTGRPAPLAAMWSAARGVAPAV